MAWVNDFSPTQIRLIGVLELSGAIGMILPLLLPSVSVLATGAAVGLALIMAGAMATHLRRSEYPMPVGNFVLLTLALFVAYPKTVGLVV